MGRVGIASVLLLALVSGTRAEITADEARSLATGILSVDFSQSPCDVVEGIPGPSYEFGASHDGVAWRAMVSSWNGKVSYDRTCCTVASRQGNGNVSPEQAEAVALAEAQRLLGSDIAQRLEWMPIDTTLGDTYHMESVTKRVGEPPRSGTVPWCAVSVCRYCGAVVAFSQRVPSMLDLVAPAVTADEAVRIAGRSPDVPPGSHPCVPSLEQNARYPGSLDWHIRFVRPGEAVGQTRGRDGRILTETGPNI